MKLYQDYKIGFHGDGTNVLTFDLEDEPVALTGKPSPTALENPIYKPLNIKAPAYLTNCTLDQTIVTATFSDNLPEHNSANEPARYELSFTLAF